MRKFMSFRDFLKSGKILAESEEVLSEFEKVFPREIVRADPKERSFEVTEENMQRIFDVLNGMFFEGRLEEVPISVMTISEAVPFFFKKLRRKINIHKLENALGLFYNESNPSMADKTFKLVKGSKFIFLQTIEDRKMSFGYAVGSLMHEMIHQYDTFFGTLLELQYFNIFDSAPFNEHNTKVFKEYMRKALDKDILVKVDAGGKKYIELNEEAQRYFLQLPVGEIKVESEEIGSGTNISFKLDNGNIAHLYL